MEIKKLKLENYRNYDSLELDFDKKNTIFIGNNAQGKTNILESIYVLGLTKSYLNINEKNLIKFNNLYTKVCGTVIDNNIEKKLEIIINEKGKKVKIDGQEVNKLSNYISKLNVIIFSPDNIRLLKDSPSYRRKYLNVEISQLYNNYINYLNNFNKILKQRNEYLKSISKSNYYDNNYLDIIDSKYCELSVNIYMYRKKFIEKLNENLKDIYYKITGFDNLKIKYISCISSNENEDISDIKKNFYERLKAEFSKDLQYKISLLGPHRDDFILELDGKNILIYGSQGQTRCAVLAIKFAEVPIFKEVLKVRPILLLDDIFSELDINKKNLLIEFIPEEIQTIITTTDLNLIDKKILNNSSIYIVDNGHVTNDINLKGK